MSTAPRILFFGYSAVGHACLELLLERGYNVVALVTHADDPGENVWFEVPATVARRFGVPILAPASARTPEWMARLEALKPDLILSAYYRHLIAEPLLRTARLGAFNLHGSLLPRFRGRAPVNWAVLHGVTETGVTLHRMVRRADAGAIVDQEAVPVGSRDTARDVFRKLVPAARAVLARQIEALLAGTAPERPQDDTRATCFPGRRPEDGRIDWRASSAQIFNLIRAVTRPYPGAFSDLDGARLLVWWAESLPAPGSPSAGTPGEVLQADPLVVATGDGAMAITDSEWIDPSSGAPAVSIPRLAPGQIF